VTDRQAGRQAGRQARRQTDRQTGRCAQLLSKRIYSWKERVFSPLRCQFEFWGPNFLQLIGAGEARGVKLLTRLRLVQRLRIYGFISSRLSAYLWHSSQFTHKNLNLHVLSGHVTEFAVHYLLWHFSNLTLWSLADSNSDIC